MRREAYVEVDPVMGHDLSFPFLMVKRGWRAVYVPEARATEKMVPTIEGEWRRKRRMMSHAWPIVLRGGLLSPRGYGPLYGLMIVSHRVLRYASPALHVLVVAAALPLARRPVYARGARRPRGAAGGGAGGRARALAAAAAGALLRAHDRRARRRALRPPAPRHAGRLGRAGGHAMTYRGKRALDIVLGGTALLLSAPLLAVSAVLIRLESHGHPIYRQRRVGLDGEPFELYKLRTMVTDAERMGTGLIVDAGDARITRIGAWLRRYSIDELPNLINVLAGEMSLVGPRPTVQVQVDQYSERQRGRLAVRPGITGWAQVNGRASLPWHERIELDLWYAEHASLRARPADHVAEPADGLRRPRALPRRDGRLARAARARPRGPAPGPCRCSGRGRSGTRRRPCRSSPGR